jgi:serine/threonine protein phosphatase Stp1
MLAQVRLRLGSVHAALLTAAAAQGEGCVMASTVVVLIARGAHFACLWAGDSRVYRLRDGTLDQLTRDHSLVQELVDEGRITEAEADVHPQRNVITRAIGGGEEAPSLDKMTGRLRAGDRFLLCSDGVCKTLPVPELGGLLSVGSPAGPLVAAVLGRSPSDNVTAVIVEVV